jgi:putative transcriptional regulator
MAITGTIHNTVAKNRLTQSITQETLAEAAGVTRQTIIALEKGNYIPSVLLAIRIAEYFNQPVEKLFFYE